MVGVSALQLGGGSVCADLVGVSQAPEKFLAGLAVLGAAWQSWSYFKPKFTFFGSSKAAPETRGTLFDPVSVQN